eukprot:scaffold3787_cov258-Pinguiococcus_pyrenoidosus.AAC.4
MQGGIFPTLAVTTMRTRTKMWMSCVMLRGASSAVRSPSQQFSTSFSGSAHFLQASVALWFQSTASPTSHGSSVPERSEPEARSDSGGRWGASRPCVAKHAADNRELPLTPLKLTL